MGNTDQNYGNNEEEVIIEATSDQSEGVTGTSENTETASEADDVFTSSQDNVSREVGGVINVTEITEEAGETPEEVVEEIEEITEEAGETPEEVVEEIEEITEEAGETPEEVEEIEEITEEAGETPEELIEGVEEIDSQDAILILEKRLSDMEEQFKKMAQSVVDNSGVIEKFKAKELFQNLQKVLADVKARADKVTEEKEGVIAEIRQKIENILESDEMKNMLKSAAQTAIDNAEVPSAPEVAPNIDEVVKKAVEQAMKGRDQIIQKQQEMIEKQQEQIKELLETKEAFFNYVIAKEGGPNLPKINELAEDNPSIKDSLTELTTKIFKWQFESE